MTVTISVLIVCAFWQFSKCIYFSVSELNYDIQDNIYHLSQLDRFRTFIWIEEELRIHPGIAVWYIYAIWFSTFITSRMRLCFYCRFCFSKIWIAGRILRDSNRRRHWCHDCSYFNYVRRIWYLQVSLSFIENSILNHIFCYSNTTIC